MRLKVFVIDFELPAGVKKWALRLGMPALFLAMGGALARAGGDAGAALITWKDGETLKAADLNANFSYLQGEVSPLVAVASVNAANVHEASSGAPLDGSTMSNAASAYTPVWVSIEPGTWWIEADATVTTTPGPDGVQLTLYDNTAAKTIAGSAGAVAVTESGAGVNLAAIRAAAIYTVTAPALVMMQGTTNGATQLHFGWAGTGLAAPMHIRAVRLR